MNIIFYISIYGIAIFFGISFIIIGLPIKGTNKNIYSLLFGIFLILITILSVLRLRL